MPAIRPISELRNYNTVLRDVTTDTPVFLTKNGRGRFAIVDIRAYERLHTELELMSALAEGEESARKCGWVSMDSARNKILSLAMFKVRFTPQSVADLEEINRYISDDLFNPRAAAELVELVFEKIRTLAAFPQTGHDCGLTSPFSRPTDSSRARITSYFTELKRKRSLLSVSCMREETIWDYLIRTKRTMMSANRSSFGSALPARSQSRLFSIFAVPATLKDNYRLSFLISSLMSFSALATRSDSRIVLLY